MSGTRIGCAIIGSGNIGADLMIKILRHSALLEMKLMIGIDPASEGLARAERLGVPTTAGGIEGMLDRADLLDAVAIVFDATSAKAHRRHAAILSEHGKIAIDLTPAAIGPYVVPPVNFNEHLGRSNVNMVTCGGQATVPIVHAVARVAPVRYAEMVSSIASRSAGPGTRQNIDEFTRTTAEALRSPGGAGQGKAIIILNPAEPPIIMRNTVYALVDNGSEDEIRRSIVDMVAAIREYVPGYRLKADPLFEDLSSRPVIFPDGQSCSGLKISVFLEVEGAAHYLPAYAGNLDIMTAAALRVGEEFARRMA
jgi:acetaldehyde dehydrogenase